ncbi:hypothetical protein ACWDA3_27935 [Nonomuraea rubra]
MVDWWANLLQGALSAVVGGVVAAVTAWAVVRLSAHQAHRQSLRVEARTSARDLVLATLTLNQQVIMLWRQTGRIKRQQWLMELDHATTGFFFSFMMHEATITAVDPAFAQRLAEIREGLSQWRMSVRGPWSYTREERREHRRLINQAPLDPQRARSPFEALTGALLHELMTWLKAPENQ